MPKLLSLWLICHFIQTFRVCCEWSTSRHEYFTTDRDTGNRWCSAFAHSTQLFWVVRTCLSTRLLRSWSVYMILIEIFHLDVLYVLWCRLSISLIRSLDLLPTFRALQLIPATRFFWDGALGRIIVGFEGRRRIRPHHDCHCRLRARRVWRPARCMNK